jgi:outer membrane protein TolC
MSWPLFSGFTTVHSVSEARSDLIIAKFERNKKKRILLQNLKRAYQLHMEARGKTTFTLKSFKSSRERAMVIQQEYSAGLKTYLDWESSQNSWTQMERRHLEALKNTWITLAKLEKARGTFKKDGLNEK